MNRQLALYGGIALANFIFVPIDLYHHGIVGLAALNLVVGILCTLVFVSIWSVK